MRFAACLSLMLLLAPGTQQANGQAASSPPKNDELYAQLTALMEKSDYAELSKVIRSVKDAKDAFTSLQWSKDQLIAGGGNHAIIAMHYSDLLGAVGMVRERWVWFAYSYLTLRVDGARCADRKGAEAVAASLLPYYVRRRQEFQGADHILRHRSVITARRFEEGSLSRRQPARRLCAAGLAYIGKYFEKHGDRGITESHPADSAVPIRTIPFDPELIDLVADDEWRRRRAEVLEEATDFLMKE